MNSPKNSWNNHYTRERSSLHYPDENLVRMIKPWKDSRADGELNLLDLGCGSGRHLLLAQDLGFYNIIGSDIAYNGLLTAQAFGHPVINADSRELPFKSSVFDAVITWGSLHYGKKETLPVMIAEIIRIMKPNGALFGTLRSDRDTMLRTGTHLGGNQWQTSLDDITGSVVSFYSEEELNEAFSVFGSFSYGLAERTPLGKSGSVISHWYFRADK